MPLALRTPLPPDTSRLFSGLALFTLAAGAPLLFEQTAIRVICGMLLYFMLPGYFVILAFLPESEWLERAVLTISASASLSTLCVLAFVLVVPGLLTFIKVWLVLCTLTALTFCVSLYFSIQRSRNTSPNKTYPADATQDRWWLLLLLIVLLSAAMRLFYLDHAELQDDEIDIANVAVRILRGEEQVIFQDRRGPAQTIIVAVAYAMGGQPSEWILRLPAVITALATLAGMIALASSMFNRWIGLFSGLLLSLDGFVFAYSRIVQMQSTLLLMMVVAVLCFYQVYRSNTQKYAVTYQALGTLFFGFGILAHYEMALLAPALLFLYSAKYGRAFWQRDKWGLVTAVSVLLLTTGAFYLAFILNPAFDETLAYYRDDIVGRTIHNNSRQLVLVGLFYNSIYFFVATYLGAAIAILVQLQRLFQRLRPLTFVLLLLGLLIGVVGLLNLGHGTQSNGVLLAAALAVAALCVVPPRLPLPMRLLCLWFAIYCIPYLFLLREVHIHYYAFSPPLAILSVLGWSKLYKLGRQRKSLSDEAHQQANRRFHKFAWAGAVALWITLSAFYLWLVFVQPMPEYALAFPKSKQPLYPTLYTLRHGEAFGFPHRSGWQTVAWLYRNGTLRGSFETNELWLKPQWYTPWQNAGDQPRYYLVADLPHRLQASPWPTPFAPDEYHLLGVVTVRQQPRLHIYERNTFTSPDTLPEQISYWADEEMAAKLDEVQTIDELYRAERYQADREFYAQAAQRLALDNDPNAGLLFYAPEQSAFFSLYDQSNRTYYMPTIATGTTIGTDTQAQVELLEQITDKERNLYALYWGVDDLPWTENLHTWLNQQLFPVSEEWIGNLRLVYYDVPSVPLAATIEQPRDIKLGSAIRFVGYTIHQEDAPEENPEENSAKRLHLSLFWRTLEPVPERYKVFVHLLDETNTLVSQQDGEPVGGQQPTDTWPASIASGTEELGLIQDNRAILLPPDIKELENYKLAVGMYNPLTGERLPVYEENGARLPDDMLLITLE